MTDEEVAAAAEEAAQRAYQAYGEAVGWQVYGGGAPMPSWANQQPRLQAAWREAARGALGLPAGCEPGAYAPRPPGDAS